MAYWMSQILVLAAYILLGFGLRKEKKIELLYYSCIYQALMLGQYVLLNGTLGIISSIMGIIRNIIFINNSRKNCGNSSAIVIIFSIISFILMCIFYTNPIDIFPCIFTILGIWIYGSTNMKMIRLGNICISICYIIYALSLNSYFSIVCEGYLIINTIIGYKKHESIT